MDAIFVQLAQPAHAAQIANLFYTGFHPDVAQLLIYGCKGASEYIRMQLASATSTSASAYYVAQRADRIIGAVELRRQPDSLFLNYIAVHPDYRGQRIGPVLLSAAVELSGVCSGQIGLDVLHDNLRALQWYTRLGFTTRTSVEFLDLSPPSGPDEELAYVSGMPQADLCQERFGFSRFDLITRKGTFSIGRIGEAWFRLTDLAAVSNPAVFTALNLLDPGRRIFAIVPASSAPLAQVVRPLAKTHGMEAGIPHLMSSLSCDYKKSQQLV